MFRVKDVQFKAYMYSSDKTDLVAYGFHSLPGVQQVQVEMGKHSGNYLKIQIKVHGCKHPSIMYFALHDIAGPIFINSKEAKHA